MNTVLKSILALLGAALIPLQAAAAVNVLACEPE